MAPHPSSDAATPRDGDPMPRSGRPAGLVLLLLALAATPAGALVGDRGQALARLLAVAPVALAAAGTVLLLPALRRRPAVLATGLSLGVALLFFAYHLRPGDASAWKGVGDAERFHRMAGEWPWKPDGWWRYRILVPALVRHLPLEIGDGYALVGFLSVVAAGPLVSALLGDLGFDGRGRLAGTTLYLGSFAPWYNSYNYVLPDPAAMVVLLLAARAVARRRDAELALWLAVGCVTKEVVLFLVPARWGFGAMEEGVRRATLRTVLAAAPAGLLFLWLRGGGDGGGGAVAFVADHAFLFPWRHQPDNVARLFSPFGAAWALAALGPRRDDPWTRAAAAFAVPVLASLLVTDSGRMLIYLMPFAVPLAVRGAGFPRGADGAVSAAAWGAVATAILSVRLWDPFLLLWAVPEPLRRGAALVLVPVVLWLALRGQTAGDPAHDEQRSAL